MLTDVGYESHAHRHQAYLTRGRYAEQIDRMGAQLGRENVHVIDSQVFFDDPVRTYRAVEEFLGLPYLGVPVFDQHNARQRAPMPASLRHRSRITSLMWTSSCCRGWGRCPRGDGDAGWSDALSRHGGNRAGS